MIASLRRWFVPAAVRAPRPISLSLEPLEDRQVPSTITAVGSSVYVIRPDNSLWERQGAGDWFKLTDGGFAASIGVVADSHSGQNAVFALTTGGWLFGYQLGSAWQPLGGYFTSLSAGTDSTGRAEAFALTVKGGLYEFNTAGATHLGDFVSTLSAAGSGSVFAILSDHSLHEHTPQGWTSVASANTTVAVSVVNEASGTQVLYSLSPNGFLYVSRVGATPSQLIGSAVGMAAGTDTSGQATLFALTGQIGPLGQTSLFEFSQHSGPLFLGNWISSLAASDQDVAFAVLTDQSVWEHAPSGWIQLASAGYAIG